MDRQEKGIKIHWLLPDKFQGPTSYIESGRVRKGTLSVSINHSLIMSRSPWECHRDEGVQQQCPKDGTHRLTLKDASQDCQLRRGLYMHRVFFEKWGLNTWRRRSSHADKPKYAAAKESDSYREHRQDRELTSSVSPGPSVLASTYKDKAFPSERQRALT